MLQFQAVTHEPAAYLANDCDPSFHALAVPDIETLIAGLPLLRRRVREKQYLFRTGQRRQSLFFIHAGCFKTCTISEDGREKITGFRLRGDLLGLDALDMPSYTYCSITRPDWKRWVSAPAP